MTIYQLINNPENLNTIVQLIRNDIIHTPSIINELSIYENYYQIEGTKGERYKALAEKYRVSEKTIQRIIKKLNKNAR